ncbi:hypothetical protein [Nonomuraea typhae]|uniref:PqqD family peptide modification chaperone n=1 Tax=Nonomuraea typhae TaxID=2603600 RepID=A0ABW7YVD2_9ACTN
MPIAMPKLRPELEVIHGMDDIPLIFDPITGTYHRITRAGEVVLSYIDGTRTRSELMDLFVNHKPDGATAIRRQVGDFLASLEDSGLLEGASLPPQAQEVTKRVRRSRLMPRVVITRSLPVLLEPVARLLRVLPSWVPTGLFGAGAVVGFAFGFHTLFATTPNLMRIIGPPFLVAAALQLVLVLFHETAHALVAQVLRVPVRGMGVALLFYFMPVAYVDRTDAYRVKSKSGRVTLAMAGIMSDGWWCGVVGLVAFATDGFVQHTAAFLLGMQLIGLIINLNPLLPTDGFVALETLAGSVDARGRAFALLKCLLLRRPLPAHLAAMSQGSRVRHIVYGTISLLYTCFLAYGILRAIPLTVELARMAVGR